MHENELEVLLSIHREQPQQFDWAAAGVCVRLTAEESGLPFLPVRTESVDFCIAERHISDPRVQGLIRLVRSRSFRRLLSDLPGYDARHS